MTQKVYVIIERVLDYHDSTSYTTVLGVYATKQLAEQNCPPDDTQSDDDGYFYSIEEKEFIGGEVVIY